jgi:hypothetical protein
MTPTAHVILAYSLAIGLLWGYAISVWWRLARFARSNTSELQQRGTGI